MKERAKRGKGPVRNAQHKVVSLRKRIRSVQRLLNSGTLSGDALQAQKKRLQELEAESARYTKAAAITAAPPKKLYLRYKQVRFFERRKIERGIRRFEKELRSSLSEEAREQTSQRLDQLRKDLNYVKFFPSTEKYISLFRSNNDESAILRREKIREIIKSNIDAAASAGVELEETTGPDEDDAFEEALLSEDNDEFFLKEDDDEEGTDAATRNLVQRDGSSIPARTSRNSSVAKLVDKPDTEEQLHHGVNEGAANGEKRKRKRKRKRPPKKI